jgi:hypothetical protein
MTTVFAKLTKICSPNMSGTMSFVMSITATPTLLTDLKVASASIAIPVSVSSIAPSPTPLRISMPFALTVQGNKSQLIPIDAVSDFADVKISAFVGAGTINGRKKVILQEAFGAVEIYSNGSGGFHTLGGFVQLKEAKALINMTTLISALGDGDTAKTRTATINIPVTTDATNGIFIAKARIDMLVNTDSSGDITVHASALIPMRVDLTAVPNVATLYNLSPGHVIDSGTEARPQASYLARVQITADGYVEHTLTSTGIAVQKFPLTDWLDQKSEAPGDFAQNPNNYKIRATLVGGTQPWTGNLLGIWIPVNTPVGLAKFGPFWENTLQSEDYRRSRILIELSDDDGATILASTTKEIICERLPVGV